MLEKVNLAEMNLSELESLLEKVKIEIENRKRSKKVFTFHFEFESDPRKGKPYAARLFLKDGKLQRQFFDLDRNYGKHSILVSGDYEAHAGDVIEERQGGSWKNDYRYWFVITEDGEKIMVADIDDPTSKALVLNYLRGKISLPALLEKIKK